MKEKKLSSHGGETHALIFETGDEVMATLLAFVKRGRVRAAHFSGIGAFRSAMLAYFDWETKKYLKLPVDEQVEVLVLTGDIAWQGDKPVAHIHVVVGRRDGSTRGGHLLKAIVRPTLELMFSEAGALERRPDPASGLALIAPEKDPPKPGSGGVLGKAGTPIPHRGRRGR
ncbi:MAG TPA: PPC domain-containing DNA-binding protein [Opitutaceae bacterium]|nr:PPC domain-containing DNA-binding protein [Opitutaceae bacterium]